MLLIGTLSLFFHFTSSAATFEKGDVFVNTPLTGQVQLVCTKTKKPSFRLNCRSSHFTPSGYSKFVTDKYIDAEGVYIWSDHDISNKHYQRYNPRTGKTNNFRLYDPDGSKYPHGVIRYSGLNKINYLFHKAGGQFGHGTFEVYLQQRKEARKCKRKKVYSSHENCGYIDTQLYFDICQKYFKQQNYCRN